MPVVQDKSTKKKDLVLHPEKMDAEFYKNLLNSIEDYAVFTIDKDGFINSWNEGAKKLLGYTEEEIIGECFAVLFTDEDLKENAEKKELKEALKSGKGIDERYHVRKDKSQFWVSGLVFPMYNNEHEHIGFTKVMRNIDERVAAEQHMQDAKNYAESIVESAREPMLVLNTDLSINTANNAFYQFFKFKKKALSAQPIYEVFQGQLDIPELRLLLDKIIIETEAVKDYEIVHDFKTIGKRTILFNGRTIYFPTTRADLVLLSIEDVTEKRSLEQQKDDFISIASHEIRTPITVIKALAQMLQKRSQKFGDESFSTSLGKIDEKTDKLMSLINYLLDVTQIETGKMRVLKSKFNIEQLLVESIEEMDIIDTGHEFIIKGSFKNDIYADRFRISQVLNNLLNNAVKYSAENTQIIVGLTKNKTGDQITVSVQDFGMGIPKEEQGKLFKRFSRSSNVKSKNIHGLGLGLHISQEIIKQHDGKIWFKSEPGEGSTFYFQIPV